MTLIDQITHTKFKVNKGNPVPVTIPILFFIFAAGAFTNSINLIILLGLLAFTVTFMLVRNCGVLIPVKILNYRKNRRNFK